MFYSQFILAKKGPLGTIWIAAHLERKLRKNQVADTDIGVSVDSILFPEAPIALRLSSHLLLGVVRIYSRKVNYLFDDCSEALLKVKQAFRSAAVDLPPEESTAPYHSITLPETFDLDDFELPDNEIFQGGNYVDHHVSTREQITLQDTMDGVVYSTSQFGLDEQFGDGDTSQAALDLDEQFQDKDVIGSDDEEGPGTDNNAYLDAATPNNAYLDAATPEIKDEMVGVSEAMPRDLNEEQVEDLAMRNEFVEDAQAPQTPGLVEVSNSTSVREQLACDDHMEVEDLNAEEGRKTSGELEANEMHKREEDPSSEHNAGESAVTPMEVDKSQIDVNVNAQNEQEEERAEHVHVTSPFYSHITTEVEDPGQVMTEVGTHADNNVVADKSDAVPPVESPGGLTMGNAEHCLSQEPNVPGEENRDHFAIATEVNEETNYRLQGYGQAYNIPDEQMNNAHATEEQLGNFTGFAHSDLPAPEQRATEKQLGNFTGFAHSDLPAPEQLNNAQATEKQLGNFTGFARSDLPAPQQLNNTQATEKQLGNFTGFARSDLPAPEQLNNAQATEKQLGNFTGFARSDLPAPQQLNNTQATEKQLGNFTGFARSDLPAPQQLNNAHGTEKQLGNFTGFARSDLPAPQQLNTAHATEKRLGNFTLFAHSDLPAAEQLNSAHGTEKQLGNVTGFARTDLPAPAPQQLNTAHATEKQLGNFTGFARSDLPAPQQLNTTHATEKQFGNFTGFARSDLPAPAPQQLNNAHTTEKQFGNFTGFARSEVPAPEQLNNAHSTEKQFGNFTGFARSDVPAPEQLNNKHATEKQFGNFTGFARSDLPAPEQLNNAHATDRQFGNFTGFARSDLPAPEQLNNAHATEKQFGNFTGFARSDLPAPATDKQWGNFTGFAHSDLPAPEQLNNAHSTEKQLGNFTLFAHSDLPAPQQLNNAHATEKQLRNFTGFAHSDLPPPEKVLAAPNGLGYGNNFMVESTPDRRFPGTCNEDARNNTVTGKKRTFTESTLTAESLNSVESVGLFQSKRTADSVPNDNDLLSSILVGKSSFLKMKPTPVLEATTTKRIRSAPRSTATKRKVQMDDPMVLHGDVIRQQLTNTEGIRRVRKKAPCTIPEILMLQRKALGDGLLREPIFTGMSMEIVSLHNEPYDLRGIMIIENERHASVQVVEDIECSVRAVEENKTEESYVPQVLPNVFEEQPAEVHTIPQDQQIIHQQDHQIIHQQDHQIIHQQDQQIIHQQGQQIIHQQGQQILHQQDQQIIHQQDQQIMHQQDQQIMHQQDQQIMHQQEEPKDNNEQLAERISDLEVLKEDDGAADEVNLVLNDEISQMPSEDKLDHGEDLQVERSHENHHDGGIWGQDVVCADLNEKSCTEVIEIAEGDIDINAVFNEPELKVEDEVPREDKKTDESAEVGEIGIDNGTPCDKTIGSIETESVEAGDLSNLAVVDCNEPLVEANNDGVDPETESYNKYEPDNDMYNEEAYTQSALDGEPSSHDGLMGDNDEMDTMEVEHDTGFLNVDDDDVEEDHEDDDTEYGDETRLLENSGWSSRTRAVAKYLQTLFGKEAESGKNVLVADKLLTGKTRKEASRLFFETLVLKTRDYVQVEQAKPYENIIIKPRPKLTKSIF